MACRIFAFTLVGSVLALYAGCFVHVTYCKGAEASPTFRYRQSIKSPESISRSLASCICAFLAATRKPCHWLDPDNQTARKLNSLTIPYRGSVRLRACLLSFLP
ncbi:hypothetical protein BJ546DRAFT_966296 [Cryomyces antarcticus]